MQIPKRRSDIFRKYDDGPIHVTEEEFTRMKERLVKLKTALPGFIQETQRTAEYGDRSENAEYKDAKATLRRTNRQILSLEDQLQRVTVIKKTKEASEKVRLGSTVILEVNGKEKIFEILGPRETDPTRGRISFESPLGAALMDRKKGDSITITTLSGPHLYRIIDIR